VGSKPLIEVGGDADVALIWNCKTLDEVDEFHEPSPFAKASGDSLRKAGKPAEALAKAGGGQAFLPSLTDALGVTIQGVALVA
jgi:hypothetical protein